MTEFQLALVEHFDSHRVDVYRNESGEMEFTREQIGEMLGYENPRMAIKDLHRRNKAFLDRYSRERNLRSGDGKSRKFTTYGFKGFIAICRYSNQPVADRVMEFLIDLADRFRMGKQLASQDTKIRRLEDELSELTDRLLIVHEQLEVFKRAEGAITIQFAAIKLKQLGVWNQSEYKLVDWMEANGIIQRCPTKRKTFVVYKKYFDRGYFDWTTFQSGDPKPLIKSEILLTPKGLTWLTEMLSALKQKMDAPLIERSVFQSRRRLEESPLPPEAGGAIEVEDECGRTHRYDTPAPVVWPSPANQTPSDPIFYDENLHRIRQKPR